MNRRIIFRGKDLNTNEWVFGDLHLLCDKPHIHTEQSPFPYAGKRSFVDTDTIGQFTGLNDKNGKDIYEGDILRKPAKNQWEEENFVGYEVFWHDNDCADNHIGWQMNRHHYNGCLCGTTDFVRFLPKYCGQMEIIGNIHDNPELLNE